MTLLNVADMFADVFEFDDVYAGNINSNLNCRIGVYNAKNCGVHTICIGGKACTKTQEKQISVLIHWTDNPTQAEKKTEEILEILASIRAYKGEDFKVHYIKCNEPNSVGRDDRGICEYVIEATIYYESEE